MPANKSECSFSVIISLCLTAIALGNFTPTVRWGHQLLTPTKDSIFDWVAADSNNGIYMVVARESQDSTGATSTNRFLLKYNQQGEALWSKQLGANGDKEPLHWNVDGLAADDRENIYVFGHTQSSLGQRNIGKYDAYYAKYSRNGAQVWVRQLGTPEHDVCAGLAIDADENIYIAGYTYGALAQSNKGKADIFVAAYDKHGKLLWQNQIGTKADERILDLRLGHNDDLYFCGTTNGSLGRENNGQDDIIVGRYQRRGKRLWIYQCGTPMHDRGICMVIGEQGQVYVGGRTEGDLAFHRSQRGYGDAYVMRLSDTGEVLWTRQFGTRGWDKTFQMARFTDGSGDILASGCQIPRPACQAFSRRYSPDGDLVWTKEFRKRSSIGGTCGRAIAIDSANNCYHAGVTRADNFAINNGTGNVFIVKFDGILEAKQTRP